MKSILYARVSSKEQEETGYSIPAQLKLLNDYARQSGYKVVREFIDVETAKRAGRENFNLMIEYLKKNTDVKAILCEKTDRLSRNFRDIAILDDLVSQQNLSIVLVKENTTISRETKSHEKFIFGIKALMAKNYIDNLSEESRKGMLEKAEQGLYPSLAPLGYKNVEFKNNGKSHKILQIDDQRAPIIQKLFRLYATGDYSLAHLVKSAHEEGLRNKNGGKVGKSAIHKILNNIIYYGEFSWNDKVYQGTHPPLVSKELFNAVQEAFEAQNRPRQTKRQFAYRGLMVCGKCGCAITAEIKKGRYIYYHCTGFKGKCGNKSVREEELSEQFAGIVKKIHINDDTLELVKQALINSHKDELEFHKKRIGIFTTQKTKLENRLHQIYVDKIDGKVSDEFYDNMVDKWQEELSQIKESMRRHENGDTNYLAQGIHILELCNKAHRLYLQQTPVKRAKLLRYILSNCTLDNATLCPTWRKPFDLLAKGLSRSNMLPTLDSRRNWASPSKCKEIRILVKMYRRRGRGTAISLYDPLPPLPQTPRPVYKNIVAMAVQVQEYMVENPQRTQTVAGNHFGVTRARVSQLMTIVENLPDDFISIMKTTKDQSLLKRFSGKSLLRIAALSTPEQRQAHIESIQNRT